APTYVRTPSKPGRDPRCRTCEAGPSAVYSMQIAVHTDAARAVRVSVAAPWYLRSTGGPYCGGAEFGCLSIHARVVQGAAGLIWVITNDPDAPARNVRIEEDSSGHAEVCDAP